MKPFSQATFLASSGSAADFPPPGPPEIAFVGRSNVGKSSAINAILGRRRLAYTSKTPGRTQTINFFDLDGGTARIVDLPGYGYARVPQVLRGQWQALVGGYISSRRTLALVVLVMDARHPLTPLDLQLIRFLGDVPLVVVLSKADKLSRKEQQAAVRTVAGTLNADALLLSSHTGQGVEECRVLLERRLGDAQQDAENKRPPVKGM